MNAPLSKSSESTNWLHLYRAAILEMDPSKLSQHVAEAENALTQREPELFQKTEDNIEEKRALDNAMDFLRTLRKTMECNSARPIVDTGHARAAGARRCVISTLFRDPRSPHYARAPIAITFF